MDCFYVRKYSVYLLSTSLMRGIVIIFSVLLSFIFGEDRAGDVCCRDLYFTDAAVKCSDKDTTDNKADFNDVAILPLRTATFSGECSSFAPSFRSTNSGRRVQPSTKSSFRVIKAGKVFDRNNFYTFRTDILQFQSGIRSNSRYIYSICRLLI